MTSALGVAVELLMRQADAWKTIWSARRWMPGTPTWPVSVVTPSCERIDAPAVPNLKKLLEHQDAEVVYASEKALKSIAVETK